MAANGSCFMVTWTIFKYHFLEVGLRQIREAMALRFSERSSLLIYSILSRVRTCMSRNLLKWHLVEGAVTYDFTTTLGSP